MRAPLDVGSGSDVPSERAGPSEPTARETIGEASSRASTAGELTPRDSRASRRADKLSSLDITLHELLGKGSYGAVYRASTTRHGAVAVKVLPWGPNEISSDMRKELRLLQRCASPYIVRALGAFSKPKELWIAMELCELGSVLDVMRSIDAPLDEDAIACACADALGGLSYLHSQKRVIIHRDIKSANLLLSSDCYVKLADFGVAAQLNSTASKRSSVIGTPHWMAPEVIQNGRYDARADVWSLGITAIEMAQLGPPLAEMRPVLKVMFAIASGAPPTFESPADHSELLCDFVAAALVKDTADRPTSVQLLEHAFVARAQRAHLRPLIEAAAYAKANPRPKSRPQSVSVHDSSGTLRIDESPGPASSDGTWGGATFVVHGTAAAGDDESTFVVHGTRCDDGACGAAACDAEAGGTLRAAGVGSGAGSARQSGGSHEDGACGAAACDAEAGGTLRAAGVGSGAGSARQSGGSHETGGSRDIYMTAGEALALEATPRAADDSDVTQTLRAHVAAHEGALPPHTNRQPPPLPAYTSHIADELLPCGASNESRNLAAVGRAASDDALFERTVLPLPLRREPPPPPLAACRRLPVCTSYALLAVEPFCRHGNRWQR